MSKISHMKSGTGLLALITSRFDDGNGLIAQVFRTDGEFRSLCEDYCDCEQALKGWQASDAATATQRQQEYSKLLAELGQDIREWLENLDVATL